MSSLIATYDISHDGRYLAGAYFFDGHEISVEEYCAIWNTAVARDIEGVDEAA